eukprot:9854713-Alexandrium_andersonii.AAC.1
MGRCSALFWPRGRVRAVVDLTCGALGPHTLRSEAVSKGSVPHSVLSKGPCSGLSSVSYTHLTLPTICSV